MFAAVETVTNADPIWASRRHDLDVPAQAPAGESVHAAPPFYVWNSCIRSDLPTMSVIVELTHGLSDL